ncbi:uncharacterized protein FOMMEDRAFT_16068 [Fomitiporia mediterranea MF3/22]|uniref:uncharacterized protein n=1 Tax=Fomitiporia mediterranea (strain MF3/22) TaxID=694068 RepID=UPI0004407D85|nr:uncharacterized protein FOMMEDRAFT_16068 [Fomitiporia mediterranea MF3/22]EJD07380.1 hypothetical protein FOMMEDRAFT_16068 [Fomitiporia mediterranea MF3/22]
MVRLPDLRPHPHPYAAYIAARPVTPGSPTVAASANMGSARERVRLAVLRLNTNASNKLSNNPPAIWPNLARREIAHSAFDLILGNSQRIHANTTVPAVRQQGAPQALSRSHCEQPWSPTPPLAPPQACTYFHASVIH